MYYNKLSDLGIKMLRSSGQFKTKCPQCSDGRKNKSDNPLSVNVTTGEYMCHNCGWNGNVRGYERNRQSKKYEKPNSDVLKSISLMEKATEWFKSRGISKKTLDKFMIYSKTEWMPQTQKEESCICFPYFKNGELVNIKYRDGAKRFKMVKGAELVFYNLSSISDRKFCIITEGEIDALSVYEAGYGCDNEANNDGELINEKFSKWGVVSVPNGASKGSQKMEYLDNCSDWFLGLDEIIVATDADEAGDMLKNELIRRLGVERCKVINYPIEEVVPIKDGQKRRCKDFNEVLMYMGKDVIINIIENSEFIPVDGIYYVDDIFESMYKNFTEGVKLGESTHFGEMDNYFRWKKGEINLFTGYGNHGKTTFVLQLMLTKSIYDDWKWAVFSPENYPANDFYDDLVEMYHGKWLRTLTKSEYIDACDFLDKHFFYVYPEDNHDVISIHDKFRHLVLKKGVDGVLIDPFNQLDHLFKPYQREDQYLSEIFKDIKRFTLLNNLCYNIITHPKNPSYNQTDKSLPVVDMYDIAGGAMWGNKMDNIISYYRPNYHIDKRSPEVDVYVQKIKRRRTGGEPGHFSLNLIWSKKRYSNSNGEMPCDPQLVNVAIKSNDLFVQQKNNENYF